MGRKYPHRNALRSDRRPTRLCSCGRTTLYQQPTTNHGLQPRLCHGPLLRRLQSLESAPCKPEDNGELQNNIPTIPMRITQSTTHRTTSQFPSQWNLVPPHQKQRPSLPGNGRSPCKLSNSNCIRSPNAPKSH